MDHDIQELVDLAARARARAHAPYSGFPVGAAVVTDAGIFVGCNVENASYGLTCCAERVAIFTAVAAGATTLHAVAVVSGPGASCCGACRQVLAEFAEDVPVHLADAEGNVRTTSLSQLLPGAFRPRHLEDGARPGEDGPQPGEGGPA